MAKIIFSGQTLVENIIEGEVTGRCYVLNVIITMTERKDMADLCIGGRGFIGSHLVRRLNNPLVIDLKNGQDASKHGVLESLKIIPKVIYMLAANLKPENDDDVRLYRNVSEYAKDVKAHVVYTS